MSDERARIARDLHDHAIQSIFAAGLGLNGLAGRVGGENGARLLRISEQLDDAITAIRRSVYALQQPREGPTMGLRSRLAQVTDEGARSLGFQPSFHTEGPVDSTVLPDVGNDLLAVLREALSNAVRHAHATSVGVQVRVGADVTLEVHDNGRGIGTPTRASGLANMSARAATHGGRCDVGDCEGGGTTVRWVVPTTVSAPRRSIDDRELQPRD